MESESCAFCHDHWNRGLLDARARDVSIGIDWRGTMMANSFRDPFWRARVEAERKADPARAAAIGDKCLTCHAPMAHTQVHRGGTEALDFAAALDMPLAQDGVSCTLCHQIQPDGLGQDAAFGGHFAIRDTREIFGPYDNVFAGPMQHHVDYTPKLGTHVQQSAFCSTCHTLFTPVVDADGKPAGLFPEQTPYLEWLNSEFPRAGRHCQDCHMQKLSEPVVISSRPPWLEPREPFWRHVFGGANTVIPARLAAAAAGTDGTNAAAEAREPFERAIKRSRLLLQQAAQVSAAASRKGGTLSLDVSVNSLTGHKLPTGIPLRRMWLHVRVVDAKGAALFESGAYDADGRIRRAGGAHEPHREIITKPDEVQVYEAVLGDAKGRRTQLLMNAASYLKDNRLLPRGWRKDGPRAGDTAVRGEAARDPDYAAGGRDNVLYRIDVGPKAGPLTAEVELLYQSIPPEWTDDLSSKPGSAGKAFIDLYNRESRTPVVMTRTRVTVAP